MPFQFEQAVVFADMPAISTETDNLEPSFLDDLLLYVSSLSSVYHKIPTTFIGGIKARKLAPSRALNLMYRAAAPLQFEGPLGAAPIRYETPCRLKAIRSLTFSPYSGAANNANLYGGNSLSNPYGSDNARPYGAEALDYEAEEVDQDIGGQDASAPGRDYISSMLGNIDLGSSLSSPSSPGEPNQSYQPGMGGPNQPYGVNGGGGSAGGQFNGSMSNPPSTGISSRNSSVDSLSGLGGPDLHPAYADLGSLGSLDGGNSGPSRTMATFQPPPVMAPAAAMAGTMGARGAMATGGSRAGQGFVPPKVLLLNPQTARGLEITGTVRTDRSPRYLATQLTNLSLQFARRAGQMYMDMDFANRGTEMLGDFAIQFNKNTWVP
jgi:hypothetical protein